MNTTTPTIKAHFDEARQSQLPFVELLLSLGYEYLSVDEALKQRGGDTSKFIMRDIAFERFKAINTYDVEGETFSFADKDVWDVIDELENIPVDGLIDTSKEVFHKLMPTKGGKTVKVFQNGKTVSKNFRFIDFTNINNNAFHVAVEFEAQGREKIRPDIVVFVNGIPFAVIENKKSSVSVEKALSQLNRNQGPEYCPKLFVYPQLLIGTNGTELKYGTVGTPNKFYAHWREKDVPQDELDSEITGYIKNHVDFDIYAQLYADLNAPISGHRQVVDRLVTEQDRSVFALFQRERFLDLCKNYVVYDAGVKKISRYQQYFAINSILQTIDNDVEGSEGKKRKGGLVWHTQGSGKSLTMVMFVKALIEHPHIDNPRVILVTDRKDLDKQIGDTFRNCNLKKDVVRAKSGEHLLQLIKDKELNVVTTLVHKFESAAKKRTDFSDEDKNIFVLIDEAHRSQNGIANLEMNRVIPNACYIGFTGTPLMKKERSSFQKFGGYIDKYTIDDALRDGVILPLIYEGRYAELEQNSAQIDRRMERITEGMSDDQIKDLQRYIGKSVIQDNPRRITEIAYDVEAHYVDQFQGTGLKAQLVAPSKYAAVLFQRYFVRGKKINTAVVISDENGIVADDESRKKEVVEYLSEITSKYKSLKSYEESVVNSFKENEDGVEMLIVVDKLLTGFDAPRNTVLYLSKDLKDHNLLQAIARVNRLFENAVKPKTSGFIIDYSENAKNLDKAMKLFGNFDEDDVRGTLIDVDEKINDLEASYGSVYNMFKDIASSDDSEEYLQRFSEEVDRRIFYDALNEFVRDFNDCLALESFSEKFEHVDTYKRELKKFVEIRKQVSLRYADRADIHEYKQSLIKILDEYVDAKGVELLTDQINITDTDKFKQAIEELHSDKSKAEAIAAQTERTIEEKYETDPEFYERFSEKISLVIDQMREGKLSDVEALKQLQLFSDEVTQKRDASLPVEITKHKGADVLYRNLKEYFEDTNIVDDEYVVCIMGIYSLIQQEAIVDWYKNQEVKRIIRNKIDDYLYDTFSKEKGIDISMEQIQNIVGKVIKLAEYNHTEFA